MNEHNDVCLGDLVAAACDAARPVSRDERDATWLATCAVGDLLLRAGRVDLARRISDLEGRHGVGRTKPKRHPARSLRGLPRRISRAA